MENIVTPNKAETECIMTVCLLAAFADGAKSDAERESIKSIAEGFSGGEVNRQALYQRVLLGQVSLAQAAQGLDRPELRRLTYEMAVCVCEADGLISQHEKSFLDQLRWLLRLDSEITDGIQKDAEAVAFSDLSTADSLPVQSPPDAVKAAVMNDSKTDDTSPMILNYAILNGALELMPQSLSTLAIIPLQMKMVYRIGKKHGYELDRGHIKELLSAAGVGLSSQVLEGYAGKLLGGLFARLGGKVGKSLATQATSSAMSFAVTYAIGHMAQSYYANGRTLSINEMRQLFEQFKGNAAAIHGTYAGEIQARSKTIDASKLASLIKSL